MRILKLVTLSLALAPAIAADELPSVHLIATGGTISGGSSGSLTAKDFAELLPGVDRVATLSAEDYVTIGSSRMTPELQFGLAERVNALFAERDDIAGIVITHGTDSLEESAFLLDLLVGDERPVVFAAAQRPPRRRDTDGPRNLMNAIRIAASKGARELGVVVTLNDEIHAARDVRKTHTAAVNAFASPWVGPLGQIDDERLYLFHRPARRLHVSTRKVEPRVSLLRLYAGSDGSYIRAAVASGQRGLVLEVFGRGNVPPAVREAVEEAIDRGVTVVYTSRTGGGRVVVDPRSERMGVLSGEDLDGLKARIVLVAALGAAADRDTIEGYFRTLSGEIVE